MNTQRRIARWPGTCCECGKQFTAGTEIMWQAPNRQSGERGRSRMWHTTCDQNNNDREGNPRPQPGNPDADRPDNQPQPPPMPPFEGNPPDGVRIVSGGDALGDTIADEVWRRIEGRIKHAIPDAPPPDGKPFRRRITIVARPEKQDIEINNAHPSFKRLLMYVNRRQHVYLYGAAGSGKSHSAQQVAMSLDLPFYYLGLTPATMPSALYGHTLATDANTIVRTPFREAWQHGGVFLLDEPDNARDDMIASINGALASRVAAFPDGMIPMHPDCIIIAAGNTPGLGGDQHYPNRRRLDEAFRSRFAFLEWSYDETLERGVARAFAPEGMATEAIDAWVTWVRDVRAFCDKRFPTIIVTPRSSYNGVSLLDCEPVAKLADAVVFTGMGTDQRKEILTACPLPSIILEKPTPEESDESVTA